MKIAISCGADNTVFQHFGHTPGFAIYEIEDKTVTGKTMLPAGTSGHGALAGLLAEAGVDVLICGGIGGGAITALQQNNIKVVGGAEGRTDDVAQAYALGKLHTRIDFHCKHHDHGDGHDCGSHSCSH
ncbi:MAG: dinitrogenase iron-molybdenum cofactor biosynthesis protein [Lentisphaerae bacterium]|nr:dinitrogenase iron-molybdenum cofactor biosynthesis protein [Lentisphaerota bacterium]